MKTSVLDLRYAPRGYCSSLWAALLARYVPAIRATKIDPMVAPAV